MTSSIPCWTVNSSPFDFSLGSCFLRRERPSTPTPHASQRPSPSSSDSLTRVFIPSWMWSLRAFMSKAASWKFIFGSCNVFWTSSMRSSVLFQKPSRIKKIKTCACAMVWHHFSFRSFLCRYLSFLGKLQVSPQGVSRLATSLRICTPSGLRLWHDSNRHRIF